MSLLFRKECQDVLNSYGLTQYHTEINGNKNISVTSECGKPLFTIKGIRFSKSSPTNKECDYALELFTKFMRKHEDIINQYIAAYVDVQAAALPADLYDSNRPSNVYAYSNANGPVYVKLGIATLNITFDKKIKSITLNTSPIDNLDELANFTQSEQYKEACELIDKLVKYKELDTIFQKINTKLNSCDI